MKKAKSRTGAAAVKENNTASVSFTFSNVNIGNVSEIHFRLVKIYYGVRFCETAAGSRAHSIHINHD